MWSLLLYVKSAALGIRPPKGSSGSCTAGDTYSITSVEQLQDEYVNGLSCIFSAGESLGMGFSAAYGQILDVVGTDLVGPYGEAFWKGKVFMEIMCDDGVQRPIMYNFIGEGQLLYPAIPYEGPAVNVTLVEGEPPLSGSYLNIDYRLDFGDYCPSGLSDDPAKGIWFKKFNNKFPVSQILDVVRMVGQGENGQAILLGRTLFQDWVTEEYRTSLWFALEVSEVHGLMPPTTITVPNSFVYELPGFVAVAKSIVGLPSELAMLAKTDPDIIRNHLYDLVGIYTPEDPVTKLTENPITQLVTNNLSFLKGFTY